MKLEKALVWGAVSSKAQDDLDVSIPQQLEAGEAWCQRNGVQVAEILRVPGFSRWYLDVEECARDMLAGGIDAFYRLMEHWKARDFDYLVVRDGDRFARTQSLHARVCEETVFRAGAKIVCTSNGMIYDEGNVAEFIALGGLMAAREIQTIRARYQRGMKARAEEGLFTGKKPFWTHLAIEDKSSKRGKRLIVDESKRAIFDAIAELFLAGHGYDNIAIELNNLGLRINGRTFSLGEIRHFLFNPIVWGHSARRWHKTAPGSRSSVIAHHGLWALDKAYEVYAPPPPEAEITRDVIPPVYEGELADQIKSEMLRRTQLHGNSKPRTTRKFTGLFQCAHCGGLLTYYISPYNVGLRCKWQFHKEMPCPNRQYMKESVLQAFLHQLLAAALSAGKDELFEDEQSDPAITQKKIADLEIDLKAQDRLIRNLVRLQATEESPHLQAIRAEELQRAALEFTNLEKALEAKREQAFLKSKSKFAKPPMSRIREVTLAKFWQLENREINQTLHALMGTRKVIINKEGDFLGVAERLHKNKRDKS
jgi:DNA invertase Pin-like site-specific DNA recombinase